MTTDDNPTPSMVGSFKVHPDSFGEPGVLRVSPPSPPLSTEECLAAGGHCHSRTGMARASSPPQYEEACKHCGHVRWAIPREAFEYREGQS